MTPPSRRNVVAGAGSLALGSLAGAVPGSAQVATGETMYVQSGNVGGRTGTIAAYDPSTGVRYWKRESGPVRATPIVVGGTIYTVDGEVAARSATTGRELWRRRVPGLPVRSSPTVVGDSVFVADQAVTVLDRSDGRIRWSETYETGGFGSPSVVDGTIYVTDDRGTVYAIDRTDGAEQWRYSVRNSADTALTVGGDTVFVSSTAGELIALDSRTRTERWRRPLGTGFLTPPVLFDDLVFVGSADGSIYAIDGTTGERSWLFSTGDVVRRPPTHAGEYAYACSMDGYLYKLDVEGGVGEWSAQILSGESYVLVPTAVVESGQVVVSSRRIQELTTVFESYGMAEGKHRWTETVPTPGGSPPTLVSDPEGGDSVDSRALSDVDGHHDVWANRSASLSFADRESADDDGSGLGLAAGAAGIAGATYLLDRYRSRRRS